MFSNNWDEFDESRDVLVDLIDEYRAAESKDYVVGHVDAIDRSSSLVMG
jgi:hypothetical protein